MSAAPTIAMLAATAGLDYEIPFSGPVAFVHVRDAADRFIGAVSKTASDALVFDMQGTPATIAEICSLIEQSVPGAGINMTGSALPFPHQKDDGALNNYLRLDDYISIEEGVSKTINTFSELAHSGKLRIDLIEELIGKKS